LKHFHKELDEMLYGDKESDDYAKGVLKVYLFTLPPLQPEEIDSDGAANYSLGIVPANCH
jgi:hypothetical protein